MSDELNETGFEPEEKEVPAPKQRSFFASLLDLVAGASVIGGFIIAGVLQDMGGGWMFLFILSGVLGAALWHLCALIADAAEKYLGDD